MWKDIKGFEGLYQVSNKGKIRSVDHIIHSKTGQTYNKKGIELKPFNVGKGYKGVYLFKNGDKHIATVHSLVANAYLKNQRKIKI